PEDARRDAVEHDHGGLLARGRLEHPRTVEYRQGKSPVRKRHELELGPLTRGELRQPSMKQVATGQPARIAERDQDHEQGVTLRLAGHRRFAHCRGLASCERGGPLSLAGANCRGLAITLTALRKGRLRSTARNGSHARAHGPTAPAAAHSLRTT